jgi:hypothetical protein
VVRLDIISKLSIPSIIHRNQIEKDQRAILSQTQSIPLETIMSKDYLSLSFFPYTQLMLTCQKQEPRPKRTDLLKTNTGFKRFPFDNFTYYLTLFSKFFSSFPHGTCSLSVSRHYLALDGIYHPFWAAFPNNPTL